MLGLASVADTFTQELGKLVGFPVHQTGSDGTSNRTVRDPISKSSWLLNTRCQHQILTAPHSSVAYSVSIPPFSYAVNSALQAALHPYFTYYNEQFQQLMFVKGSLLETLSAVFGVFLHLSSEIMSIYSFELQRFENRIDLKAFQIRWTVPSLVQLRSVKARDVFDNITIEYMCTWPSRLLFDKATWTIYQKVHSYVLYMNYARFSLQSVNALKQQNNNRDDLSLRQTAKMRMKLMHFINSLQTYVMHGVLQAQSKALLDTMRSETHMDGLMDQHTRFVESLEEHLFLTDRALALRKEIFGIFEMCIEMESIFVALQDTRTTTRLVPSPASFLAKARVSPAVARLIELERLYDDAVRFLVEGLTVMAVRAGVSVEILALSLRKSA
eukprot:jgi/Hompol1/3996/HPOL_000692-RA